MGPAGCGNGSKAALLDAVDGATSLARTPFSPGWSYDPAGSTAVGSSDATAKAHVGVWCESGVIHTSALVFGHSARS
jgi:hypothetical protein